MALEKVNGESAQTLHCAVSFPQVGLVSLPAEARSFDRWGAVLRVRLGELEGRKIRSQESVLMVIGLPASHRYGQRAIHCIGTTTNVSESAGDSIWLVVRFRQLYFRQVDTGGQASVVMVPGRRGDRDTTIVG